MTRGACLMLFLVAAAVTRASAGRLGAGAIRALLNTEVTCPKPTGPAYGEARRAEVAGWPRKHGHQCTA